MKSLNLTYEAMTFLAILTIAAQLAAQGVVTRAKTSTHHHYQLIDLGTFGGPASYFSNGFDGILNNRGTSIGWSDTPTPDPHPATCFDPDCFVAHAFQAR